MTYICISCYHVGPANQSREARPIFYCAYADTAGSGDGYTLTCVSALQHAATHYNTPQYAATHCYCSYVEPAGIGGFYRNVIPMRWDCGKNPIVNSVYLTGSRRIFPSQ